VAGSSAAGSAQQAAADVPSDEVQNVIDRVRNVADGATAPNRDLVNTLVDDFLAAVDDRDLTDAEREQLRTDARAVLDSAHISRDGPPRHC
jgi:hypothetical protein